MADRVSYTLRHPITREIKDANGDYREEEIRPAGHSFVLKRAKGRHIEALEKIKSEAEQSIYMIARVTGLTMDEVRDMDVEDMAGLGEMLEDFFGVGRKTGAAA